MEGGKYSVFLPEDDGSQIRSLLYSIESLGIICSRRVKNNSKGIYTYEWGFTKTGNDMVKKNEKLQELLKNGRLQEFHDLIKEIL